MGTLHVYGTHLIGPASSASLSASLGDAVNYPKRHFAFKETPLFLVRQREKNQTHDPGYQPKDRDFESRRVCLKGKQYVKTGTWISSKREVKETWSTQWRGERKSEEEKKKGRQERGREEVEANCRGRAE